MDLWIDFGVDLLLSAKSIADFFLIGVALISFVDCNGAVGLAGVAGILVALPKFKDFEEEKDGFFLLIDALSSWLELELCYNQKIENF